MIYLSEKQRKIISASLEIGSWLTYIGIGLIFARVLLRWEVLKIAITLFFIGIIIMMAKKPIEERLEMVV